MEPPLVELVLGPRARRLVLEGARLAAALAERVEPVWDVETAERAVVAERVAPVERALVAALRAILLLK